VVDRHGVVATITVPDDDHAYVLTVLRDKERNVKTPHRWMLDDPRDAVSLYCKKGKHDVAVPLDDLREGVERYRRGESQVKIPVRFRRVRA
jgi:hypothetical protein